MRESSKHFTFCLAFSCLIVSCRSESDYYMKTAFMKSSGSGAPVLVEETTKLQADNDSLAYVQAFKLWKLRTEKPAAPGRTPVRFRLYDFQDKPVYSPY